MAEESYEIFGWDLFQDENRVQCVSQKIPKPCSSVRDCVFACVPLSPLSVHPLTPAPSWDSPQVLIFCTDAPRGLSGPGEYLSAGCFDALLTFCSRSCHCPDFPDEEPEAQSQVTSLRWCGEQVPELDRLAPEVCSGQSH
ncbi:uncharacterized protein [Vicugna pacos]|uniref:Uncharacterized protein isoform X2 n=1 Tax=Vicugna pacos TaxID=30538 RepID=A0ABM5DI36_VICPA